ncbi:helix-turn-helix transcriptional regulator [Pantoea sp. Tr-811]|uniref:AraC family transcriptional regulator n=1 Tax=Pantoea sp. Tr-811 TaxID=2608361 RepID=UPI00141FBC8B|nr:helix-turn-helix domain-containing protein [Pantoea sp. Tr-811]NIF27556.1 helix-turn-helix transcriptional regulator [Pantoea sp. Tr-811]
MNAAANGWQGELWLGIDHALLLGTPGSTHPHAHYAHQVMVGLGGDLQACIGGQYQCGPVLQVASQQAHALLGHQSPCLTLFAEPLAFTLDDLAKVGPAPGEAPERVMQRLRQWPRRALDPRLNEALSRIRALDEQRLPARQLADAAALSLSQLERLFSAELHTSVRRLVLWQRLRLALHAALDGASLTVAAHAAGFADSAHLSRSVRKQFGLRASDLLGRLRLHPFA